MELAIRVTDKVVGKRSHASLNLWEDIDSPLVAHERNLSFMYEGQRSHVVALYKCILVKEGKDV